jgi:hypothetical protein
MRFLILALFLTVATAAEPPAGAAVADSQAVADAAALDAAVGRIRLFLDRIEQQAWMCATTHKDQAVTLDRALLAWNTRHAFLRTRAELIFTSRQLDSGKELPQLMHEKDLWQSSLRRELMADPRALLAETCAAIPKLLDSAEYDPDRQFPRDAELIRAAPRNTVR